MILQLIVSGLANGCVYGLIALGFVLIYKATEAVNFAQGDFMMLGAFITLGLTNDQFWGLPFWVSVPIAIAAMGLFGYLLDMIVLRRMFGQSQIAIVILTIAMGFVLRFAAGVIGATSRSRCNRPSRDRMCASADWCSGWTRSPSSS